MATDKTDTTRRISLRAQILQVGEGRIIFKLSGSEGTIAVPASRDDEMWAGAKIYHYIGLDVEIGPGK